MISRATIQNPIRSNLPGFRTFPPVVVVSLLFPLASFRFAIPPISRSNAIHLCEQATFFLCSPRSTSSASVLLPQRGQLKMATTCEAARIIESPMTSPTTASPRLLAVPSLDDPASATSHQMSPRTNPPPNPPFIFPARNPSSAPSSFSRATGRRPRSAIETGKAVPEPTTQIERRSRPNALPDFSFNPGATLPPQDNGFLVPPLSPQSPTADRKSVV